MYRPLSTNVQGAVALLAIGFLTWATWRQLRRPLTAAVPWRNTDVTFGLVSRVAHWATATLVLCLMPIGLFMQTLPVTSPDRPVFLAVHETLGLTVLVLVLARIAWLARSKPPAPSSTALWPALHNQVLPALFYVIIAVHLGAVVKHHFLAGRAADVRRMLR